jgi:phycocyanobilin lyase beta subunit
MSTAALAQKLIRAVDEADSSSRLLEAVENLASACLIEAIPTLVAVLGYNNPGAAVASVDGLIQIGKPAVQPLLDLLDTHNYTARAWAVRALAGIGDPRGLDILLDAAKNDFAVSVRRAATRGLGTVLWNELPPDRMQPAQSAALEALLQIAQDPEWVVRYAAVTGLQALAAHVVDQPNLIAQILAKLNQMSATDADLTIQFRSRLAVQKLQPEATAISENVSDLSISLELDWRLTLEKLYQRKSQERLAFSEGDPRKFRELVVTPYQLGHASLTD